MPDIENIRGDFMPARTMCRTDDGQDIWDSDIIYRAVAIIGIKFIDDVETDDVDEDTPWLSKTKDKLDLLRKEVVE